MKMAILPRIKLVWWFAALLACVVQSANAICTFDLRALQISGGGGIDSPKSVRVGPDSVVTFGLYAVVTGLNATVDETFQYALTSVVTFGSGAKSIRGNLSEVAIDPNFQTGAFFRGKVIDLNGDGDLDVGGPIAGATSVTGNFIIVRSASQTGSLPGVSTDIPSPTAAGRSFLFGTVTFTVTSIVGGGSGISANFAIPTFGSAVFNAQRAAYATDGATKNGGTAANPTVFAGTDVFIGVRSSPEISIEQPVGFDLPDGGSKSFGTTGVGANSSLTFTIKNIGNQDLTGLTTTVDGTDAAMFTVTNAPTAPVPGPNGSTTFTVRFAPTSVGTKTAQIHIANNDPDENPFDLTLTGATPGIVDLGFNPSVLGTYVSATTVQPDGQILMAGNFTTLAGQGRNNLARLNANGTVETAGTFNPGTGTDFDVSCLAVQPDGKILLGGGFGTVNGQPRNRIARLNSDGSVEGTPSFNPGTGASDFIYCIIPQVDGKILISGEFTNFNGVIRNRIARLDGNGALESTVTFNPGTGANSTVSSIALQPDGKILLAGSFTTVNGQPRNRLARLNADGTLESLTTFDPGIGANGDIYALAVQPDGKILLAGDFTSVNGQARGRIARLLADGSVETIGTFNVGSGVDAAIYTIALQADGRFFVGGDFTNVDGQPRNRIARLNGDGSPEDLNHFNIGAGADGTVTSLAVQADGAVLAAGSFENLNGEVRAKVARLANEAANQSIPTPTISRTQWMRSGAAPEVEHVTFELSTNGGTSWTSLGAGVRFAGGWERTGLSLPGSGMIRARGRTVGCVQNGSAGLIEQISTYSALDVSTTPPTLTAPASNATFLNVVSVAFDLPEAALAGSVKLTFHDGITPRVMILASTQESAGAHAFAFNAASPLDALQIASGPALPEGIYTATLSFQDALGNTAASSSTRTNIRIATTPIRLWKLVNLGSVSAGDLADPDSDGLFTLTEYGLNLPPQTPNGSPFTVTRFTYPDGKKLRAFFQRDPSHDDVTVEIQSAASPGGAWTTLATSVLGAPFSGPGYFGGDAATPGFKTVEIRDTVNVDDTPARFLRAKVTH